MPTLIDHIWVNFPDTFFSGIITLETTDHCPTYVLFSSLTGVCHQPDEPELGKITFRNKCKRFVEFFRKKLSDFNWNFLRNDDTSLFEQSLIDKLNMLYSESFPIQSKLISKKRRSKP